MSNQTARILPLSIAVAAAVVVFGCGGGGGGGSTSTTSTTSNTNTGTTASATSTTAGSTGTIYTANEIIFGLPNSDGTTFNVEEMKPDGTGTTALLSSISQDIILFAQATGSSGKFVAAADWTGNQTTFGIYLTSKLSSTGTTTLVNPIYSAVNSLAVSADGKHIVYTAVLVADKTQTSYLYVEPIGGGTPVQYGPADFASISPSDSNTIGYTATTSASVDQVYTRSLSAGAGGTPTQLTTDGANHLLPAFNRTGTQLAYWEETTAPVDTPFTITLSSKSVTTLQNPGQVVPVGQAFSADGTELAFVGDVGIGSSEILTEPVAGGTAPTTIVTNTNFELGNYGIYWTDSNGRGNYSSIMAGAVRRRRGRNFFVHGGK